MKVYKKSVSQKGHLIVVFKWYRILKFLWFSSLLSNQKTNFKSQFRFSIKIEKWISVRFFFQIFFCSRVLIWSVTLFKWPLKNQSFHLFSVFFFKKNKTQILIFVLTLFRMGILGAVHRSGGRGWGEGGKKALPSLKSVTRILQWWNLVQLYLTSHTPWVLLTSAIFY